MTVRIALSLCALCALCGENSFAAPRLSSIAPRGAQRGTEVVLSFTGTNLDDAREVIAYGPGVAVKKVETVSPTQVKVTAVVAPDCRLGEHAFRLRCDSGITELKTLWVGALPTVEEKEPNSEFEKPQAIPLNVTVHGTIGGEDQDFFVVECKKGQRLAVEVEGMRLAGTFWDPSVAILDARRFELATNDDHPVVAQDSRCAAVIPADGKYVVLIRESAYGTGSQYRLHVGTFPSPAAVVPAGGRPGEEVEVRFLGDPLGEIKRKVKLPAKADPDYRLHAETADGVSPTGFPFRVVDLPSVAEAGDNLTPQTAAAGAAPGAFNGVIAKPGEARYFKFAAKKGDVYDIHCYARRIGSQLDPVLYVGPLGKGPSASNDDKGGPDSDIRFTAPADGEYAVWVHDHLKNGGAGYFFRIELTPVRPEAVLSIPKVDGNNPQNQDRQVIAVPRGNRYAALVNVTRKDFGGPLAVGFDHLPSGVKLVADAVDAGQSAVPVVFEAAPDAAVGGVMGHFTATPTDPKQPAVPSRTSMDTVLTGRGNNGPYWRHETDTVAAAVTEAAPFALEVIEPKVPLVQNGTMSLRVVAKRFDGFTGPITVAPVWTPPGVGIQPTATIPEGATEVTVSVNANGNAAVRKWKTAVIGSATPGEAEGDKKAMAARRRVGGRTWASSQLFTLEVAPPMVTFAMTRTNVEQGQPAKLVCKVAVNTPFEGQADVKLVGLPVKATAPDLKLTKDAKELTFDVTTDKTTPAGKHKVFCQVIVPVNGEPVSHNAGGSDLRVDAPLAAKATTPAKAATGKK